MATWTFEWINEAPVEEFTTDDELQAYVAQFKNSVAGWIGQGTDVRTWDKSHKDYQNQLEGLDDMYLNLSATSVHEVNLVYIVMGTPVGLLLMNHGGGPNFPPYVDYVIAHPAVENCGAILLECAATVSQRHGDRGELKLWPLNPSVQKYYELLGFSVLKDGHMLLKPEESDKWTKVGGSWKLSKYLSTPKYTKTTLTQPH
jgi:hypothetical protein